MSFSSSPHITKKINQVVNPSNTIMVGERGTTDSTETCRARDD